jgi:formate-dependent nitrite reductase membrane component NrfD
VNAFHVCGGLLAVWAVVVTAIGLTRENFPATTASARLTGAISVILVAAAIGTAVYTGAHEEDDEDGGESAVLVLYA